MATAHKTQFSAFGKRCKEALERHNWDLHTAVMQSGNRVLAERAATYTPFLTFFWSIN